MRREANFIEFPGTGMWMIFGRYQEDTFFHLYRNLTVEQTKTVVNNSNLRVFWIDQGTGASILLKVRQGGTSSSVTEVTPRILAQYLKE